ncbi:hypothetical protein DER29_4360 [Micromonospora sp. M71_S20]|uniref:hypothetical protein n=1 Tax=Micromonospora sp. M71_S20 TaxID=592872 RepID=UPI000F2C6982|nr:hypothetical protein [Micromonospora sp. M71_S20]RLK13342.1 hypothetical protein DER29_4360 [Micromonospora sp. M71_S20]
MLHAIMAAVPTPSPMPDPGSGTALLEHAMSPTEVAILLLLAIVVDYMSIGPNSLRDRLAFLMAVPAIKEGFDESPADKATVEALGGAIERLLDSTGGAYIAGASVNFVLGALVGLLWIYTIGCMMPVKLSKKMGRFATLTWPQSPLYRLNGRMWLVAILLGMMSDLPGGLIGDITRSLLDIATGLVAFLPGLLFGDA